MTRVDELESICRRLEVATEIAKIAVWEWNCKTNELHWTPAVMEILGVKPDKISGHLSDFLDRLVPEDKTRVQAALRNHIERDVPYAIQFEMFHESGRRVSVAAQGQIVRSNEGAPLQMIGTVRDVSEQRGLENRLLRAEKIAKIGHWIFDVKENKAIWSPETFRIHGWDPNTDEPDVERAIELYHPDDRDAVSQNLAKSLETGAFQDMDAKLVLDNGETRHVRIQAEPTFSADGSPERIFGVLHDRTDIIEKERQLEQAQRLQVFGQLAGGVAHDFNNLMAVILGNLELLQDAAFDYLSDNDKEMIEASLRALVRGRDLTQSLLSFSQSIPLKPEPISPTKLVAETVDVLRRTIPASIQLSVPEGNTSEPILGDRTNLEACLINLALNARDAIKGSGEITFVARDEDLGPLSIKNSDLDVEPGKYVVFEVADNGIGIPPEEISSVFEPFFTTKPTGEGSGLGLSRVKGFAQQSGGTAQITSEVGIGTTVKLYMPAYLDIEQNRRSLREHDGPDDQSLRILLVEDQEEVRKVIRLMLERRNHEVLEASDGQSALELFSSNDNIDLVLCDIVMPGDLQGPDVAREIRTSVPGTKVIFMTGYVQDSSQLGDGVSNSDQIIAKPISRSELYQALAAVTDNSR